MVTNEVFRNFLKNGSKNFSHFSVRMLSLIASFSREKLFVKFFFQVISSQRCTEADDWMTLFFTFFILLKKEWISLIQKLSSHGFEKNHSVFQAFWPNLACVCPLYYFWISFSYCLISCSIKWWDLDVTFRKWFLSWFWSWNELWPI